MCESESVRLHVCDFVHVGKGAFEILSEGVIWLLKVVQFVNKSPAEKKLLISLGILKAPCAPERPLLSVKKIKENLLRPTQISTDANKQYCHRQREM